MPTEVTIPTRFGEFSALDYGGEGPTVLAVHELFVHNAASWAEFADVIDGRARVIALDREGHGQTRIPATPSIDICGALSDVVEHLGAVGEHAPILVGSGSGGWDVTLAALTGAVRARGIVTMEATYCVSRDRLIEYVSQFAATDDVGGLWATLELGWTGTEAEKDAQIQRMYGVYDTNWIIGEVRRDVWEASVRRAFVREGDGWLRQPVADAMTGLAWERINAEPHPSPEAFAKLAVPATFIVAEGGLYAYFAPEIDAMVADDPNRRLRIVPAINNVLNTHPGIVADEVMALLKATAGAAV